VALDGCFGTDLVDYMFASVQLAKRNLLSVFNDIRLLSLFRFFLPILCDECLLCVYIYIYIYIYT